VSTVPSYSVIPGAEPLSIEGTGDRARVGVAIVHGFTGNPISVKPLGEALAAEGYTVEVPRIPGHGTNWRDLAKTRWSDWIGEAERVVKSLASRTDQVVLVGLSAGGTWLLDVASRGVVEPVGIATINALILDRDDPIAKASPILSKIIPVVPSPAAGIKKNDISKPGGDEKAYAYTPTKAGWSLTKELPALRSRLKNITCPVLVIHSAQDHTVPAKNSKALAKALGSTDVAELTLDRSFHLATLDWDADILTAAVVSFVARVTGTDAAASTTPAKKAPAKKPVTKKAPAKKATATSASSKGNGAKKTAVKKSISRG